MYTVSELFIYPIKSMGGISVKESKITRHGLLYDRRWMLVNMQNVFISQREDVSLALLQVSLLADGLKVTHKITGAHHVVPFEPQTQEEAVVSVFENVLLGQFASKETDAWFSKILNLDCRLVYMPEKSLRYVDTNYAKDGELTAFSDGFPMLMLGEQSMNKLNQLLETPIPINRFRPNIVFSGGEPHDEDEMTHFKINEMDFYGSKICARCRIPTINQDSGEISKEPTRTMARYRTHDHKVYFGQNLLYRGEGVIKIGDTINVLKKSKSVFSKVS